MESERGPETAASVSSPTVPGVPPPKMPPAVAETLFEIAVATLWSDGPLTQHDVKRGRAVAKALGTSPRRGGVLGALADGALPFSEIGFEQLDSTAASRAYAIAQWLCCGTPDSPMRNAFMSALRTRLSLAPRLATVLMQHAQGAERSKAPLDAQVRTLLSVAAAA